ncbi:MAG: UDP-2,3-diacylglucosamine diphosphatase LpxI [Deltaproteobacteria bacterium]
MTEDLPLGIIAGGGQFPLLCARAARKKGYKVFAVGHLGETDPSMEQEVNEIVWIHLGQLGRLITSLKKAGVSKTIFAGTITKKRIFRDVRPDMRALALWGQLRGRLDDEILRAIAKELESEGIHVLPSTALLDELAAPVGILTKKTPTRKQREDMEFGWHIAKTVGSLDIGQCIVVKDKVILAVEAMEGTDETIVRGGRLGGPGAVVIKVFKPHQDPRFDLPSVGITTIERMEEVKASALLIEAGRTLFFDRHEAISRADSAGIAVVAKEGTLA